jgi:sarcosine oxidase, subunit gamma
MSDSPCFYSFNQKVTERLGIFIAISSDMLRYNLRTRKPEGLPIRIGTSSVFGGGTACCLGPDEWLILLPEGSALPKFAGSHSLTDVSHRAVGVLLQGPKAAIVLQSGCPLDSHITKFPLGKAVRILYDSVEIILWRIADDQFHVEVWRSFSEYLLGALTTSASHL